MYIAGNFCSVARSAQCGHAWSRTFRPPHPTKPDRSRCAISFQPPSAMMYRRSGPLPAVVGVWLGFWRLFGAAGETIPIGVRGTIQLHSRRHSKFYDRHLKPILCQRSSNAASHARYAALSARSSRAKPRTLIQRSSPKSALIRASVPGDRVEDRPRCRYVRILDDFHEIMNRKPTITLKPDDHHWPQRAVTSRVEGLDCFPNVF